MSLINEVTCKLIVERNNFILEQHTDEVAGNAVGTACQFTRAEVRTVQEASRFR